MTDGDSSRSKELCVKSRGRAGWQAILRGVSRGLLIRGMLCENIETVYIPGKLMRQYRANDSEYP